MCYTCIVASEKSFVLMTVPESGPETHVSMVAVQQIGGRKWCGSIVVENNRTSRRKS